MVTKYHPSTNNTQENISNKELMLWMLEAKVYISLSCPSTNLYTAFSIVVDEIVISIEK